MKKIAIVGAGQAGLQLGFELLSHGCEVTLYTDRSSQEVLNGPTGPIAIQFHPRTVIEHELGLDFWFTYDGARIDATVMKLFSPDGEKVLEAGAMLSSPAQAIDLRLKYATWLMEFPRRGGAVVVGPADLALLEQAAATHDAVFVTTGNNTFQELFPRDPERSELDRPYRHLTLFFAKNCVMDPDVDPAIHVNGLNSIVGVGECLFYNFLDRDLTKTWVLLFEGVPGGPLDLLGHGGSVLAQFEQVRNYLKDACPQVHAMIASAELVEHETMQGAITPTVRRAVGRLPSGKVAMALGDALVSYDPMTAQGLNAASRSAHHIAQAILAAPDAVFDAQWIDAVFLDYWKTARHAFHLTRDFVTQLQPHQQLALYAASVIPEIASDVFDNAGEMEKIYAWFSDADATMAYLKEKGFTPEPAGG
ncbi:hypothetical protein NM04_08620 [Massilia aurea]|uniref:Styrene monooxygenase StyA putative substrate binding domain-containing protein n=1 Tax=Massilia aurea TaxID=373040 RepID=A0A422QMH0_9BURK|nr:styrene monooxygenase/indole monooxygenase family protein [Massilia aurea]RNF31168.1 hypothetical protein NM04_08620 [Massilia aurea]